MTTINVPQHLKKVDFPATKQEIISGAKNSDADQDVMNALNGLPDKTYDSMEEVGKALKQ